MSRFRTKIFSGYYVLKYIFREKSANRVFQGWQEASISFAPTYKYDYGTDTYDSSEKARIPAWCDRVLWQRESDQSGANILDSGICVFYDRYEIKTSDHRPVVALIDVSVPKVNEQLLEEVIAEEIERQTLTSGKNQKSIFLKIKILCYFLEN